MKTLISTKEKGTMNKSNRNSLGIQKNRSGYKTLLFDFDGTLVDTVPQILESFQHVHETLRGEKGDAEQILATIGMPLEQSFDAFSPDLRDRAIEIYRTHNQRIMRMGTAVFIGIPDMLAQLKAMGIRIGVVTSKRYESAFRTACQFNIERYFDIFIAKESTDEHKPHPAPILRAIKEMKEKYPGEPEVAAGNTLFIGDSVHDLKCARNARVDIGIVEWTRMNKDLLKRENPDYWFASPLEIVSRIEQE
jgi:pyrophosphatase PpaX